MRKNGSQKKTMFSTITKIISTISAQIVMIGIESEQIRPRSKESPSASLPSIASLRVAHPLHLLAQLARDQEADVLAELAQVPDARVDRQ